ncbi:MAG: hypothetical protein HGB22_06900, partial [Chlorobiaceae bacterium]|nr:hypothetical protein [Chlorobiaceae bacterium]
GADSPLSWSLQNAGLPVLKSGGVDVTYSVTHGATETIQATAGGNNIFVYKVNQTTGAYTFTLQGQLDHPAGGDDSQTMLLDLSGAIIATDKDGDAISLDTGSMQISVEDDVPAQTTLTATGSVHEDALATGNSSGESGKTATATGSLVTLATAGADSPLSWSLQNAGLPSLTSDGVAVTYSVTHGATETIQAQAGLTNVFELLLDSTTGAYTFTLQAQLDHPADAANDSQTMLLDLSGAVVVTDKDGDSMSIDSNSFRISVEDDIPAQTTATVTGFVQEDGLTSGNSSGEATPTLISTGDLSSLATAGADGFKSWSVEATGLPSLTSDGVAVTYSVTHGATETIQAKAGSKDIFTLFVNSSTGYYSFDLQGPLDHSAAGNDSQTMLLDLSTGVWMTDRDGDAVALDAGSFRISVEDDVPIAIGESDTLLEGEVTHTGSVVTNDLPGADGLRRVTGFEYRDEWNALQSATIAPGTYAVANTHYGSITMWSTGAWSYMSVSYEDQSTVDPLPDTIHYSIIDKDGSIASADLVLNVSDTAPTIGTPDTDTVYEKNLPAGSDPNAGALTQSGTLAVTMGADPANTTFGTNTPISGLKSNGVAVNYDISSVDRHTLTGYTSSIGDPVFVVTINNPADISAGYEFTLYKPLDHVSGVTVPGHSNQIDLVFNYKVADYDGDVPTQSFTISVIDDQPLSINSMELLEDHSKTINTNADATQANTSITPPLALYGNAVINADGTLTYTPHHNYSGGDRVVYTTINEYGASIVTTVNVTVHPVSDAPGVSRDAASVPTSEDVSVALGFKAPTVTDNNDENGSGSGTDDNPERLSVITLSGITSGSKLLDKFGNTLWTSGGTDVTILLSDGQNIDGASGTLTMTKAQFEDLRVLPPADNATNFTVTMSVTEYEVDDSGMPISGVPGATSSISVGVDVQAVTDLVALSWATGDPDNRDITIAEDTAFNLTSLLTYSFAGEPTETTTQSPAVADGNNTSPDFDGTETRWLVIGSVTGAMLPSGSNVYVSGSPISAESDGTYRIGLTNSQTIPTILIQPPSNFSGDLLLVPVTVFALDHDGDSSVTPVQQYDTVYFNLYTTPVAGDIVTLGGVSTVEDTSVLFMDTLDVTDTDGSESITGITLKDLETGWKVYDKDANLLFTGNGTNDMNVVSGDIASGDFKLYEIRPAAHSSADKSITIDVETTDVKLVNSSTVTDIKTTTETVNVTVRPVGEVVGGRSDADSVDDLVINPDHTYSSAYEDTWFNLATDTGFALKDGWFSALDVSSDQDTDEVVTVLLTPRDSTGTPLVGSSFTYSGLASPLVFSGSPVEIPAGKLSSLQFLAPTNYSSPTPVTITVQANTVDTDPDTLLTDTQISGSATLTIPNINPVADPVTLSASSPGGLEDGTIPLRIRATSLDTDGSEVITIRIRYIPQGAVMHYVYGSTDLSYTATNANPALNVFEIPTFNNSGTLTIIPPLNSDVDMADLNALSVDGFSTDGGVSVSVTTTLPLSVAVTGVADPADFITATPVMQENAIDANLHHFDLSNAITTALPTDNDGSETLTIRLTGLDPAFKLDGATFLGGEGLSRTWVVDAVDLPGLNIVVPNNFSGTFNLDATPVTTELEGNSLTGSTRHLTIKVAPSPEAGINTTASIPEDELQQLSFAIHYNNGDNNEVLSAVYLNQIDVDGLIAPPDFTLYYGNNTTTRLADVVAPSGDVTIVDIGGINYYKLTGTAISSVYAINKHDVAANYNIGVLYDIQDTPVDLSLPTVTLQSAASYSLQFSPVTDLIDTALGALSLTNGATDGDIVGNQVTLKKNSTLTVPFTVTELDQNEGPNNTPNGADLDGSEKVQYIIVDGVPQGVRVLGGYYIGDTDSDPNTARWMVDINPDDPVTSPSGNTYSIGLVIDGTNAQLQGLDSTITITAYSQDTGTITNATSSETVGISFASFNADNPATDQPPIITQWAPASAYQPVEDTSVTLSGIVDASITNSGNFSITLTNITSGTIVIGMQREVLPSGAIVYTAFSNGGQSTLDGLLAGITITPPSNFNSNNHPGGITFDLTLTTYAPGGNENVQTFQVLNKPVTPVTDAMGIVIDAPSVDEDNTETFTVTLSNLHDGSAAHMDDGSFTTVLDGKLYIKVDSTNMVPATGSSLSLVSGGTGITTEHVTGISGVPDGDYAVVSGVSMAIPVKVSYIPLANSSGTVALTAYVRNQETAASNVRTASSSGSFTINPVNDGYGVTASDTAGDEDTMIPLVLIVSGLVDHIDGSESVFSAVLENVPNDFIVYAGSSAGTATLALNVGNDGSGNNSWSIPINPATGMLPAYIAIKPPLNVSRTLTGLTLKVFSGEAGLDPRETSTSFDLTVNPKADPIDSALFVPTTSLGREGDMVPLNLNLTCSDQDGSETVTLQFTGIPAYAVFKDESGATVAAGYSGGVYTLTGIPVYDVAGILDVNHLHVVQAAFSGSVSVTAWTVDGSDNSSALAVTKSFNLNISQRAATSGDDTLIYDGSSSRTFDGLGGFDTLLLRQGEATITFDGTMTTTIHNIEMIDLTAPGLNTLSSLDPDDVINMTDAGHKLYVLGTSEDYVNMPSASWTLSGSETYNSHNYNTYTSTIPGSAATVSIEQNIHTSLI